MSCEIYDRIIEGSKQRVEKVTAFMGIYQDASSGWWFAINWKHKRLSCFKADTTARKWCRDANIAFAGLPATNTEIEQFNEQMKLKCWVIVQHLGDCAVWEKQQPRFDATGRHVMGAQTKPVSPDHDLEWEILQRRHDATQHPMHNPDRLASDILMYAVNAKPMVRVPVTPDEPTERKER